MTRELKTQQAKLADLMTTAKALESDWLKNQPQLYPMLVRTNFFAAMAMRSLNAPRVEIAIRELTEILPPKKKVKR